MDLSTSGKRRRGVRQSRMLAGIDQIFEVAATNMVQRPAFEAAWGQYPRPAAFQE